MAEGQGEPGQVVAKALGVTDVGGIAKATWGLEGQAVPGRAVRAPAAVAGGNQVQVGELPGEG